jgi:hypothetical protein
MRELVRGAALVVALTLTTGTAGSIAAQEEPVAGRFASPGEVFVGSEMESYLRFLQSEGSAGVYPWSIRGLSPQEVERIAPADTLHPWAHRYRLRDRPGGGLRLGLISPDAAMIFNSAFPYGANNGPVWAGRGITGAVRAGFYARWGPASLVVAPLAFHATNAEFDLVPTGRQGRLAFADGRFPSQIDLPQRFGDAPYARVDPGQSTLRLDVPVLTLGVSTANQHWGPASEHPILLGNNAPGFLHAFAGTSAPLDLWLGRVHGRIVWGRLEQSPYSVVEGPLSRRFMSGLVGVFTPRGVAGLEIGGARFFHQKWPEDGLNATDLLKPFEGLLKENLRHREDPVIPGEPTTDPDNQLASIFFRWAPPASGFEIYGEYGREDHSWNLRDLILAPDYTGGYMLGFRRLWRRSPREWIALRGELLDLQIGHLARVRASTPFYIHAWNRQGHTHHGQIIGSAAGYGGAGSLLAADRYHPGGRWTLAWRRAVRMDRGVVAGAQNSDQRAVDVMHSLGLETLVFRGRFALSAGVEGVHSLNRNFDSNRFNLNATLGVRAGVH